ncbi:MAG: chemotaxis protein CheB [Ferruginibacter sp.]
MANSNIEKTKIPSKNLFPVVGIGASAGGLDAFKKLIGAITENSGMAYILVQHLHPGHKSDLAEILQRHARIPVEEIKDNVVVEPNKIYVIPSNQTLVATDGILQLSPRPEGNQQFLSVDILFSSLAEVHRDHSIGIVLSGTGADGSTGLKDIKDNGGLTIAQDPETAAYTGMPQNAIDADIIDFTLAPELIPDKLLQIKQSYGEPVEDDKKDEEQETNEQFKKIVMLLKVKVGVDFSFYKQTTVRRRILRRMVLLNQENIADYLDYLRNDKAELNTLFFDLLIPVTFFFRDAEMFDTLCETIFHDLLKHKSLTNPLRIWVAGCSTGQEAYSMAICLHEFLGDKRADVKIQIFATDLSEISVKKARIGLYSKKETEGVSEGRLARFFHKTNGDYQIKKTVRDMCVFAVHNFLKDPPFANLDLISCRNVLIYLKPFLQKKAFSMFHYALNANGTLLLGKSETIGNSSELFATDGKGDKFFTRKPTPGKFRNLLSEPNEKILNQTIFAKRNDEKSTDFQKSADDLLLAQYTPVGVVVNDQFDIVQFRGLTGEFLEPSPGKASLNVLRMAKEGLAFEIRNALQKAKMTGNAFSKNGIGINGGKNFVSVEVVQLRNTIDVYFLILFKNDTSVLRTLGNAGEGMRTNADSIRIDQLEKELLQLREDMRSITEEQEAANEELQSSNEELLSGSEELQSLNEELETSKEELQSTNEELITVNQELYDRNDEIDQSRKFAESILAVLHEPLLLLDTKFRIKRANASFYRMYKLTESEVKGKILFELQEKIWDHPDLRHEFAELANNIHKKRELEIALTFPKRGERHLCFNMQTINRDSGEQLILLAFEDITERKNIEKLNVNRANAVLKEHEKLHHFLMDSPALFAILKGPNHVFEFANTMYHEFTGNKDLIGKAIVDAMPELSEQGFIKLLDDVFRTGINYLAKEKPLFLKTGNVKTDNTFLNFSYQATKDDQGVIDGILVFAYDVTELVNGRKLLESNAAMIHDLYMNAPAFLCTFRGPDHIYELVNPSYQKIFGNRELVGKKVMEAIPELEGQVFNKILDNVYATGEIYVGIEVRGIFSRDVGLEPEECWFNLSYQPIYDVDKKITGILVFGYEVTEEVKGKKLQEESAERFQMMADAMPQKMWIADGDGNINYFNTAWLSYTKKTFNELKNIGWETIIHPDDIEDYHTNWQHCLKTGEDFLIEQRFLQHDGSFRWQLSKALAQKDGNGNVIAWIGIHADIEYQKMKQQEKDEFISIASHEMKTPLTTAKGFLQLLESTIDKDNTVANLYAEKASNSIKRLSELVAELLDVSKIQYGKLNYTIEEFNFNGLIEDTVESVQLSTPKHTIVKTGSTGNFTGDKNRLQQVIINLLTNAVKYSLNAKEVFIDVKEKDGEILVAVKDGGLGISKQNLDKIFDKYFRVEEHAIEFQGLGIGLYISHEIIVRHHGKLWVESVVGEGSTFYFTLPL